MTIAIPIHPTSINGNICNDPSLGSPDSISKLRYPAVVAGGISQALLTTAFGLITAMIIQFFQNFFVSRIDKLILDMEENSVKLVDQLFELNATKKSK